MISNFDYKIEFYKAGLLVGIINQAENVSFELIQNSGCGNFSITLARRFDNYSDIVDYNNEVRIYVNGILYFTGIIIDFIPELSTGENVQITGTGYIEQFNWARVSATYAGLDVSTIMQNIVTTYIVPYGNVTIGSITLSGYVVSSITFNDQTVKDCLQMLQELSGVNIVEVDENKHFNVYIRATARSYWDESLWDRSLWDATVGTAHYVFVGDKIQNYKTINTSTDLRNSIKLLGARSGGIIFTFTLTDPTSIAIYKLRETVETVSSIDNNTDANQYCVIKLQTYAYPTKRTTCNLVNYFDAIVRAGDFLNVRMPDNTNNTHFVISASYELSDAGMTMGIQGDTLVPFWSNDWKRIGRQLVNLQNQNP